MTLRTALTAFVIALAMAGCSRPGVEDQAGTAPAEKKAAAAFMATTRGEPGVKALPSGVLYKVVRSGPADGMRPQLTDEVKVNYEGKLTNGTVFDSSYERGVPANMPLNQLIEAWKEALQQMRPGDEWILYVPPEQGYGSEDKGVIPPNSVLIFRIELLGVLPGPGRVLNG
ncbi:MAG: FKBP-type peptidyl-prolyl cis-trans isomerase [Phenylobacterium sp.]